MTTKIEWTEETWNPSIGCSKISSGCTNCYAEVMANRLKAMGTKNYEDGFAFKIVPERLQQPLKKKKPTVFFVNSMSDLFHEQMPFEYFEMIIDVIRKTPQHNYQLLTKRAERMAEFCNRVKLPKNIWLGVTVESIDYKDRIDFLRNIPASIKFLSCEPLLSDLGKLNLNNIDWVIAGGESGNKARPMKEEWVLNIQEQCIEQDVAFFFKQWGTWGADGVKRNKKQNGKLLKGKVYQSFPKL